MSDSSEFSVEDSIISFTKRSKADLITYYGKGPEDKINEDDIRIIGDLIQYYRVRTEERQKVILMLQTLGGSINSALSLMENVRDIYKLGVESIVFRVAKSSGAFLAMASDELYMQKGSQLSDFTLDKSVNDIAYNAAQSKTLVLGAQGLLGPLSFDYWIPTFVLSTKEHGTPIPKEELVENAGVRRLRNFRTRTKALGYVHNQLVRELRNPDTETTKIYGFNENLFKS